MKNILLVITILLCSSLGYAGELDGGGSGITYGPGATPNDGGLGYDNDDNRDAAYEGNPNDPNWESLYNPPLGGRQFNWIHLAKEFVSLDPIDLELTIAPSGGTTEYMFVENISNNSGEAWTDYHVLFGVGMGEDFAPLSDFGTDYAGLDFDTPDADPTPEFVYVNNDLLNDDPLDTTPIFATLFHGDQQLNFQDGVFASPNIKDAILAFSIDVPDLDEFPDGYTFTIRQYPTVQSVPDNTVVPEPASLALLGSGLLGALGLGLKKKNGS